MLLGCECECEGGCEWSECKVVVCECEGVVCECEGGCEGECESEKGCEYVCERVVSEEDCVCDVGFSVCIYSSSSTVTYPILCTFLEVVCY